MAKVLKQYRYYTNNNDNISLSTHDVSAFVNGTAFTGFTPIVQLGVQALPGTKFYLNNGINPIIIGSTGIFELNIDGLFEINTIKFDAKSMEIIKDNSNAYLIVDTLYDNGEGGT